MPRSGGNGLRDDAWPAQLVHSMCALSASAAATREAIAYPRLDDGPVVQNRAVRRAWDAWRCDATSTLPAEAAVEFDCAVHGFDDDAVVFAAKGFEHADEIAGVGDGGAEAFANRFAGGAPAEVVVATGAGRLGHELDLARVACELEHRLVFGVKAGEFERAAVGVAGVDLFERVPEPVE